MSTPVRPLPALQCTAATRAAPPRSHASTLAAAGRSSAAGGAQWSGHANRSTRTPGKASALYSRPVSEHRFHRR